MPNKSNHKLYYRGYLIERFEFDYSKNKDHKWCAHNEDDPEEGTQISSTIDEMLDIIDELIETNQ